MFRYLLTAFLLFPLVLSGCNDSPAVGASSPGEGGVLVVATRNGPTTWYVGADQDPAGPEHDLVEAFAEAQGWTVEWQVHESTAAVLAALDEGEAHLAAAGLTHLPARDDRFEQGLSHGEVVQQVVCHREDRPLPDTVEELADVDLHVTGESSYAGRLERLSEQFDELAFETHADVSTEVLLTRVAEREIGCTVADSTIVQVLRRHWPHLEVAFDLDDPEPVGWYAANSLEDLARTTRDWRAGDKGQAAVDRVREHYYAYIGEFDFVDLRALNRRLDERLPRYLDEFEKAGEVTGLPVDLLAAMAYQESHWDPEAVSPTGVRGIMMLTQPTAKSLGVENRLDPEESIIGGARYLADRHERLPADIPEPDRTYLALASYNIGRAHVLDARKLARELGRDPDSWSDMREVLPLKADKRYYPKTKYGYARGYEPVHYVQRIRNYRDVIARALYADLP
ncbi:MULTISPECIES: membrane-bound lytic murein transglycosylase MltF [unclassified Guyparkeria]|uniref:membrane-bound lytic murein transglycosylase MltF n=1 Tax=unclassified Guyparkeria TaxID=2626246 RepID=UPI0007335C75|nr:MULTISPECIES: membrane-bound lytic murein transglycosylase MltF [unclassified Guyparkeria]KTG16231.1 murein transglycosylase [Guyparkeria sp. XI15]OAE85082.1 murein transglycosylase [Guyparkeria sp. WRN-7]